jgi:hypothetical protein
LSRSLLIDLSWPMLVPAYQKTIESLILNFKHVSVGRSISSDLILKLFYEDLVSFSSFKKSLNAVMSIISMELDFTSKTGNFHSGTLIFPMLHNLVLIFKVIGATQLTVRFEFSELTLSAHVVFKLIIGKSYFTQGALENLRIQPIHHDVVHFVTKA